MRRERTARDVDKADLECEEMDKLGGYVLDMAWEIEKSAN